VDTITYEMANCFRGDEERKRLFLKIECKNRNRELLKFNNTSLD